MSLDSIDGNRLNEIISNAILSRSAKGILLELLALPEGTDINLKVVMQGKEGRRATATALHELEREGYYTCKKIPSPENQGKWVWDKQVYCIPVPIEQRTWKPNKKERTASLIKKNPSHRIAPKIGYARMYSGVYPEAIIESGSLAITNPDLAVEAFGWNPFTVMPTSEIDCVWRCKEGHLWEESPHYRVLFNSKCRQCYPRRGGGFDDAKPGHLYVLCDEVQGKQTIQFGISNIVKTRLSKHRSSGFVSEPLTLIEFEVGKDARSLETTIKRLMISSNVSSCTDCGTIFDGSTESFFLSNTTRAFRSDFSSLTGVPI